ncbi:MAG: hypothetical protein EOO73_15035 [Myxococcales bacterium]|nr:MAG: hypothetical protein EOO73_15035 [Myxococcales bacterium]
MGRFNRGWVVGVFCAAGCGQDLSLPDGYGQQKASGGAGPAEGVTGVSGSGGASGSNSSAPLKESVAASKGGSGSSKGGGGAGGLPPMDPAEAGHGGESGGTGGSAGEGGEVAPPPRLLFSEYVEGSKSNKALEIFALEGGSLQGCELHTFFNGKAAPSKVALDGSVASEAVLVLCSHDLYESGEAACDVASNLSFNGDDALALVCQGVVQDILGEIGVDPGDSWGAGATLDHTLQRRCEVKTGRTDPATPFGIDAEWLTFGVDTFSDLGRRLCDPVSRSTP